MFSFCSEKEFNSAFIYRNNDILITIDNTLTTEKDLIDYYSKSINSPFLNDNWDGWLDAICDLSWLPQRYVYVFHKDLPSLNDTDLRFYIGAMIHADSYWSSYATLIHNGKYPNWACFGLQVLFEKRLETRIRLMYDLLKKDFTCKGNLPQQ